MQNFEKEKEYFKKVVYDLDVNDYPGVILSLQMLARNLECTFDGYRFSLGAVADILNKCKARYGKTSSEYLVFHIMDSIEDVKKLCFLKNEQIRMLTPVRLQPLMMVMLVALNSKSQVDKVQFEIALNKL